MAHVRDCLLILFGFVSMCVAILAFEEWRKYLRDRLRAELKENPSRWRKAGRRRTRIGLRITLGWLTFFCVLSFWSGIPDAPNEWGDWAAGAFAPVAFGWLVLGYFQQGEELRIQANELRASVQQQTALSQAARQQVSHLEDANRPWVDFKAEVGRLVFEPDCMRLLLRLRLDNAGKSPAHRVQISARLFIDNVMPGVTAESEAVNARAEAEAKKDERRGTTLLPNRKRVVPMRFDMPVAIVQGALAALPDNRIMRLHIALCLHYTFGSVGHGWTEKVVYLQNIDPIQKVYVPIDHAQGEHAVGTLDMRETPECRGLR